MEIIKNLTWHQLLGIICLAASVFSLFELLNLKKGNLASWHKKEIENKEDLEVKHLIQSRTVRTIGFFIAFGFSAYKSFM